MMTPELLHYIAAGTGISLGAIGAGVGQGIAGLGAEEAAVRQPTGNEEAFRALLIGLALIEGGVIIALVTTLFILFGRVESITYEIAFVELGIGLAVGIAAAAISIASSFVVKASIQSILRQPFFASKIITFMLIAQSIIEAPVIFAFIIGLVVRAHLFDDITLFESTRLFASALMIGIGCIGPSIGQAIFAAAACRSIGINKDAYSRLFPFALINEAIIETPMIFCMLLSLMMIYSSQPPTESWIGAVKYLIAAGTLGIGALGSSTGIGYASSRSCSAIALEPSTYETILRSTLLSIAFIESVMVYTLIVAIFLII